MTKGTMRRVNGANGVPGAATGPARSGLGPAHAEVKPERDQVQRRAYEVYMRRLASGAPGDEASDWAQAERELAVRAE